jgi:two-component system KDP operon response regulator KdpE
MTALIIDDEIQIRRLLRLALESRGYQVREAENGRLGLQEAAFHRPDVVLLDLGLPDMDGLEVLKNLRVYATHLRNKLGGRLVISNEPGIGYRLLELSV